MAGFLMEGEAGADLAPAALSYGRRVLKQKPTDAP